MKRVYKVKFFFRRNDACRWIDSFPLSTIQSCLLVSEYGEICFLNARGVCTMDRGSKGNERKGGFSVEGGRGSAVPRYLPN